MAGLSSRCAALQLCFPNVLATSQPSRILDKLKILPGTQRRTKGNKAVSHIAIHLKTTICLRGAAQPCEGTRVQCNGQIPIPSVNTAHSAQAEVVNDHHGTAGHRKRNECKEYEVNWRAGNIDTIIVAIKHDSQFLCDAGRCYLHSVHKVQSAKQYNY